MTFTITIKNCKKLKVGDVVTSDPYVIVEINGKQLKTKTIKNTLNPKFDETFTFENVKPGDVCKLEVWDWDKKKKESDKDDKLGEVQFTIEETPEGNVEKILKWNTKGKVTLEYFLDYPLQKHIKQVEEWSLRGFKDVIFDSKSCGWDGCRQKFLEAVFGKENLAFIIEDSNKNIFGGYVYAKIDKYSNLDTMMNSIRDFDSFIFSLESKETSEEPTKFNVIEGYYAFGLFENGQYLFTLGGDLYISGPEVRNKCYLNGNDYRYVFSCSKNIFYGDSGEDAFFTVERIQVWQMAETEEYKKKIEEMEKVAEESRAKYQEDFNALKELTGMNITKVLFDSEYDRWSYGNSLFSSKLLGKYEVAVVIVDTNNNIFGVYIDEIIREIDECVKDKNAFVFSLKSNGRLDKPMKFPIKDEKNAFYLNETQNSNLFSVGDNYDISVSKGDCQDSKIGNGCCQTGFDYQGHENVLCGGKKFRVERIFVLQMA